MLSLHLETGLATAAAVVLTLYLVLYKLQTVKTHPDEPPIIASGIPFVGHLLGMALKGGRYIKQIGLSNPDKPIFTLPVPGSRIYIVTDPSLAAAVQRASKALSFTPLVPGLTQRVLGLDAATVAIVRQNLDPEPGDPRGFLADMHDMVYAYLGPGPDLDDLTLSAATELARQLDTYAGTVGAAAVVDDLLAWTRHFVAQGSARFLYGDRNPLALDPSLESSFWDFDHGLGGLLAGVAPSLTARRAHRGRERLASALAAYLRAGEHLVVAAGAGAGAGAGAAARIVRDRVAVAERHGWTIDATARSELSFLFAAIVNTATTAFWAVLHLFARPDLLAVVRAEVAAATAGAAAAAGGEKPKQQQQEKQNDEDAPPPPTLSLSALRASSPTLLAVVRECLRLNSDNYSTRLVVGPDDAVLATHHRLRAGAVVQVAGGVMHADARIWGGPAAAGEFDPGRFLGGRQGQGQGQGHGQGQHHPAAFRAFGGGKTLCPGRHFATSEILAFVAVVVMTFDIGSVGGETIEIPPKDDGVLPVHILEPREPVRVLVRVREGARGVRVVA
ncbi:putative cytochrome p450 protein [Phialemonium atrogriseum]|uniref:Cytochrome p450 protein n=1 Tax=Phialemonium atrogriseum TaxID=1093897 RepID=A0AAJ0C0E2_9PEZI|nr:putative cytochrome p450 protein [Phialemonium atrogriseum]KAK1767814.1 putative cytochrome p450 protein [Phialemonium atrogriseum]